MKKRLAILALLVTVSTVAEAHHRRGTLTLTPGGPFDINAPFNGPNPSDIKVTLTNPTGPKLAWQASSNQPWLTVNPNGGPSSFLKGGESVELTLSMNVVSPALPVGDYTGVVTVVSPPGAPTQSVSVTVNLHVLSTAAILVNPTSLAFAAPSGATTPPPDKTFNVKNSGGSPLDWTTSITAGQTWLHVTPSGGTLGVGASIDVTVHVDVVASSKSADITVSGTGTSSGATPRVVNVQYTISSLPVFNLSPTGLTFDAAENGADPPPQFAGLSNQGGLSMNWSTTVTPASNWLTVSPSSGTLGPGQPVTLTLSVDVTPGGVALVSNTYITDIQFIGDNGTTNSPKLRITLNVNSEPKITLNPKTFSFTVSVDDGTSPPAGLSVTNTGSGTLDWELAGGASWLTASPGGGSLSPSTSTSLVLTANVAGLSPGIYNTSILIQNRTMPAPATPATNSPQTVDVQLTVTPPKKPTSAPVGQCGLMGLEALLPALGILAWRRSARRKDAA